MHSKPSTNVCQDSPVIEEVRSPDCPHCGFSLLVDKDFIHECSAMDGVFVSYLDYYAQRGGVAPDEDSELEYELSKPARKCGKAYVEFLGAESMEYYYKAVDCNKWYCPTCGGKGGKVHEKRKQAVYDRVGDLAGQFVRQIIFTVPEAYRKKFESRKGLNRLFNAAKRVIEKHFPDSAAVAYMHLFGDSDQTKIHPHVNVHLFEPEQGSVWRIEETKLRAIKETWRKALIGMGCSGLEVVDVNYSYRVGIPKIKHAIRYMARPMDKRHLDQNWKDQDKVRFLVMDLKGFQWVRFWGKLANSEYKEGCIAQEIQAAEKKIGERLIFQRVVTKGEFDSTHRVGIDLEDLGNGLFRCPNKKRRW